MNNAFNEKNISDFVVSYPLINMLVEYLEMDLNMIFMSSKDNTPDKLKEHVESEIRRSRLFKFLGIYPLFQESNEVMIKFVSEYADMENRLMESNCDDLKLYLDYINYAKINNIRERILACNVYIDFNILFDKIKENKLTNANNFNVNELVDYLKMDFDDRFSNNINTSIIS